MSENFMPGPVPNSTHEDARNVQLRLQELRGRLNLDRSKEEKLSKVCQDFESIFIGQIWKQMRASVPKDGLFQSKEEESYLSMFDQELSMKMSQAGGIGLADLLQSNLSERLAQASRDTSSSVPLLPLDKSALARTSSPQTQSRTLATQTVQHEAELLAQRIAQRAAESEPLAADSAATVKVSLMELEKALQSVRLDGSHKM